MVKIPLSGFSHCFQLCLNPRKQKESQAIFMKTVYADNAATTALCPEALDAMVDCLKNNYGNASSLHHNAFLFHQVHRLLLQIVLGIARACL